MEDNKIRKTLIVSFPRSGQHLLIRGLQWVYSDLIVYSESYFVEHNMDNCRFVNIQKSHDFDLNLVVNPELFYVVAYREFKSCMLSCFDFDAKARQKPISDCTETDFLELVESKSARYNGFVAKWVNSEQPENVLRFRFEDIVSYPSQAIRSISSRIIHSMSTVASVDNGTESALASFDAAVHSWKKRIPEEHRFYEVLCKYCDDNGIA